ncbi:DUF460 domain-containing protein [Candidatus Micrarchaeota archaeon]|nr:DUF460 domain-containing protein [Candidatus Micrarchaeota archaeon]
MIYTIVGIDAGINTGYAILDLSGNLVSSGTLKEASDEKIVSVISQFGIPIIVASDTHPPSHFVKKVAARLNVKLFYPSQSLSKIEKREIGKKLANLEDPHVRDSYAGAVKAYRKYQNRLRQIDHMAIDEGKKDLLKKMIIAGERISEQVLLTP